MFNSLWISKTGLDAQQLNMNIIANNLANVNTNGFKRSRAIFEDLVYQNCNSFVGESDSGTNYTSNLQMGTGVKSIGTEIVNTQGSFIPTNSFQDVAIDGSGFFQVTLPNGELAYSRDGAFHFNKIGQLVNRLGFPVQQDSIKIPKEFLKSNLRIEKNGSITVDNLKDENEDPEVVGQLKIFCFSNPSGLSNIGNNLFSETSRSGRSEEYIPGENNSGQIKSSCLESSNVDVAEELVNLIQVQRAYEINGKAISGSDQMLQKLSQL